MQDRSDYHMHAHRVTPVRQHYAEANTPQKPRLPTWLKIAALVACLGMAGGLADANAAPPMPGDVPPCESRGV